MSETLAAENDINRKVEKKDFHSWVGSAVSRRLIKIFCINTSAWTPKSFRESVIKRLIVELALLWISEGLRRKHSTTKHCLVIACRDKIALSRALQDSAIRYIERALMGLLCSVVLQRVVNHITCESILASLHVATVNKLSM